MAGADNCSTNLGPSHEDLNKFESHLFHSCPCNFVILMLCSRKLE